MKISNAHVSESYFSCSYLSHGCCCKGPQSCLRHLGSGQDTAGDRAAHYLSNPFKFQTDVCSYLLFHLLNGARALRTRSPRTLSSTISCPSSFWVLLYVTLTQVLLLIPTAPPQSLPVGPLSWIQGTTVVQRGDEQETKADSKVLPQLTPTNPHGARPRAQRAPG